METKTERHLKSIDESLKGILREMRKRNEKFTVNIELNDRETIFDADQYAQRLAARLAAVARGE